MSYQGEDFVMNFIVNVCVVWNLVQKQFPLQLACCKIVFVKLVQFVGDVIVDWFTNELVDLHLYQK